MLLIKAKLAISPSIHSPGVLKAACKHDESTVPSEKPLFLHRGHSLHVVRAGLVCALTCCDLSFFGSKDIFSPPKHPLTVLKLVDFIKMTFKSS